MLHINNNDRIIIDNGEERLAAAGHDSAMTTLFLNHIEGVERVDEEEVVIYYQESQIRRTFCQLFDYAILYNRVGYEEYLKSFLKLLEMKEGKFAMKDDVITRVKVDGITFLYFDKTNEFIGHFDAFFVQVTMDGIQLKGDE